MSRSIKLAIGIIATFSTLLKIHASCPNPHQPISVRYPPSLLLSNSADAANVTNWTPPPSPASIYGNWWYTYTSQTAYLSLYNFQQSYYPIILLSNSTTTSPSPPQNYDLTSYQLPGNNSHIYTTLGIDTLISSPTDPWHFAYQTVGAYNASDTYDVIAWGYDGYADGCDCEDTMWFLLYEGAVSQLGSPADMAILSRKAGGPSWEVRKAIVQAVEEQLGDPALTALATGMKAVPNDGRRAGMEGVVCDGVCALDENEPPAS